jgi:NAD(P)-dependent dehydrogenase (short-subunit alcohol dehydrogenase family)
MQEGARVAITGTKQSALDAARRELGDEVVAAMSDAGDMAAQRNLAETIRVAFGMLDILVINAGIAEMRRSINGMRRPLTAR